MGLFSKKSKQISADEPGVIGTEDEVLGFFDELFRQRLPITIRNKEKKRWICNIYSLDVDNKVMRIEDSPGLLENNNMPIQGGFALDRVWFLFQTRLIVHGGKPYLRLPTLVKQGERRKAPRVTLPTRDKVAVSILESLGKGVGLTGYGVDISTDGMCLVIDRAIRLDNEQKLSVHSELLKRGTHLMIVKVKGIPGVPQFEAEGIVNRISGPGTWKLAIQFAKIPGSAKGALESFVSSRYNPPQPIRRSFKKRQEMQAKMEESRDKEPVSKSSEPIREIPRDSKGQIKFVKDDFGPRSDQESENEVKVSQSPTEYKPSRSFLSSTLAPPPPPPLASDPKDEPPAQVELEPLIQLEPLEPQEPLKPILLSLGEELRDVLDFFKEATQYDWIHVDSPMRFLKYLNERKTSHLLLPIEYKGQSMLEYLEKINNMGVLKDVDIIVFSTEPVSPRDIIKCKILGIEHRFILPLESPKEILDIISASNPDPQ